MKPDVFEFTDYRSFLREFFAQIKRKNHSWSYGAWAQKIGLKSNTSLIKVIQGQRNPGPEMVEKLCRFFKFNDRQRCHFEDLVLLQKTKSSPRAKKLLTNRIQSRSNQTLTVLTDQQFRAISDWWNYSIRQLCEIGPIPNDSEWISKKLLFPVSPGKVKKSIQNLLDLKLLCFDEQTNQLTKGPSSIRFLPDMKNLAVQSYHRAMLENASASISKVPVHERHLLGMTFPMNVSKVANAKAVLQNFLEEFQIQFSTDVADHIYQFQLQLFPLTKRLELKENKNEKH